MPTEVNSQRGTLPRHALIDSFESHQGNIFSSVRKHSYREVFWSTPRYDAIEWQGRRESNSQPPVLETGALPIELRPYASVRTIQQSW